MSTWKVVPVFFLAALAVGCTQNPPKESFSSVELKSQAGAAIESSVQERGEQTVINQVMAESGMDDVIEQLPAMVAMGFDQQPAPPISRMEYDAFRKNLIEVFNPGKVRGIVVDYLDAHYEPERFAKMLAMLKKPLAKKMTALEIEASTPQAQQEMMQMGNIIMGQASPARLELVRKLDEAMSATEMSLDMQMMMTETMMTNMNKIISPEQRMTEEQLGQMLNQMRMQSLFPARQYTQLSFVYAYRAVSDAELNEYIQLHQSELGRWSTELMRNAWLNVSDSVATDLAGRIEKEFIKNNAL